MKRIETLFHKLRMPHYARIILITAILVISFCLGGTFAWLNSSDSITNEIGIMQFIFSHQIEEDFASPDPNSYLVEGNIVPKANWVNNDGDIALFARVKVFPVMTTPDGLVHLEAQFGKQLAYMGLDSVHWKDGGDGYFYYLDKLMPGDSSPPLFEQVKLNQDVVKTSDAVLSVTLISETVETNKWHYREAWWGSDAEINSGPLGVIDSTLRALAQ